MVVSVPQNHSNKKKKKVKQLGRSKQSVKKSVPNVKRVKIQGQSQTPGHVMNVRGVSNVKKMKQRGERENIVVSQTRRCPPEIEEKQMDCDVLSEKSLCLSWIV